MSGYGQAEDVRKAEEAGFDRHLTKPVDPRRLEAALRDLGIETYNHPAPAAPAPNGSPVSRRVSPVGDFLQK
jgi:CheY-like chemotaxis protein